EVIVLTGFRPDLSFLSEIRLGLDERLQAPVALAPLIDPDQHSCGTVHPHGHRELAHPEPDIYLVGMKSYGRAPTFLAMTGYEQVRSVAAAIAGDLEAAGKVELTLPETGVCGGAGLFDAPGTEESGGCCTPAPQPVQLAAPTALSATTLSATTLSATAPAGGEPPAGGCCGA
ncbi:flavoprotein, partial [Streptomyces sp. NPDC057052]